MFRFLINTILATLAFSSQSSQAEPNELFTGTFESENRENFGTDNPGEYRMVVTAVTSQKYNIATYHNGTLQSQQQVSRCAEKDESYLSRRPPGRAEVLCATPGQGSFAYAENGIDVQTFSARPKGSPESNEPPKLKRHKAKYYAHVGWAVYAFRKVR
jgi:hypothetical protein